MKKKLVELFTARWSRIGLPLAVLLVGLVLTASRVKLQQSTYSASARLWIPTKMFVFNKDGESSNSGDSALTTGPNALKTACEIMHSDAVTKLAYEELVKKLGPKCPSSDVIQAGLKAKPVESTDILDIGYTAQDPDTAISVLQAVLDAFYRENNIQVAGPIQKSKVRLEQQLKIAQEEYSKTKNKVKQFQDSTSFIDMATDVTTLSTQKVDLEKSIEDCKHELSSLHSKLDYAQKQLGFGPESVVAVQKLSDDEIMRSLRQSIAETEVSLIQLRSKYQDEHPKVKRLKATLEEAKKGMEARYTAIIGRPGLKEAFITGGSGSSSGTHSSSGTGSANSSSGTGSMGNSENAQTRMISDMAESSTGIASLQAKIASLSSSLAQIKSKLASVPAKQVELANIHRADELATNSLTSIERELQRIHLSESVVTGSSSTMQIIDEPSISGTSTPNIWIFGFGASLFSAALIAALQFLLTPKRISAARLQTLMPVRTVGFIPQIDRGRGNSTSLIASTDRVRLALNGWFIDGETVPVILTSGGKDDGKSMTAYALSVCLADAGKNVLLIDADTKSPTIHRMCGISASPGLLQYLKDPTCDNLQIMQAIRPNLTVIPAGGISDNASCIKDSRFTRLVTEFSKNFDAIIIDSADCGDSLDSLVTPLFDCRWIAVVRIGQTLIQSVENLGTQLELIPSMESVLVVNGVRTKDIAQLRQSTAGAGSVSGTTSGAALPTRADAKQFAESENAAW